MGKKLAQRVLIVGSGSLFDEGLRHLLLREQTRLEVSSVIYMSDADFLQHVLSQRPTVIVLFEGGPLSVSRVFELIGSISGMATPRVITVLAETSAVEVYEQQQVTTIATTRGGDFIDLIEQNAPDESNAY